MTSLFALAIGPCGVPEPRIPAGNRLTTFKTARSAFRALRPHLFPSSRNSEQVASICGNRRGHGPSTSAILQSQKGYLRLPRLLLSPSRALFVVRSKAPALDRRRCQSRWLRGRRVVLVAHPNRSAAGDAYGSLRPSSNISCSLVPDLINPQRRSPAKTPSNPSPVAGFFDRNGASPATRRADPSHGRGGRSAVRGRGDQCSPWTPSSVRTTLSPASRKPALVLESVASLPSAHGLAILVSQPYRCPRHSPHTTPLNRHS